VLTGFGVKPFYMCLALAPAIILWRSRWPELVALRWGLLAFFVGEAFCAVNFLAFHDDSYLSEYLHSFGMVLCFGFATRAAFEGMDRWLIRYSDAAKTCAALPLCRQCIKHADVPCGLRRMFCLVIPATMVMACMPLTAIFSADSYNTTILGTYYNPPPPPFQRPFGARAKTPETRPECRPTWPNSPLGNTCPQPSSWCLRNAHGVKWPLSRLAVPSFRDYSGGTAERDVGPCAASAARFQVRLDLS